MYLVLGILGITGVILSIASVVISIGLLIRAKNMPKKSQEAL